jgi:hypothetical protein
MFIIFANFIRDLVTMLLEIVGKVKLLINVQNISFAYILNHFFI